MLAVGGGLTLLRRTQIPLEYGGSPHESRRPRRNFVCAQRLWMSQSVEAMRGRVWSVAARKKVCAMSQSRRGPGNRTREEAPVRSGRCPPFQGRIFPPSSPGEKVAPLNRSVAAKWVVWLGGGGCRSVALGTGTTKDGTRDGPRGVSLGACAISLMVPRCAQDTCCTRAPYIARRPPSVAVWLPAPPRLACTP